MGRLGDGFCARPPLPVRPRNQLLFDQGQALRAAIHAVMHRHSPLDPPLTAKTVQVRLGRHPAPAIRTIQWHMRAIRTEHANQSLRLAQFKADAA